MRYEAGTIYGVLNLVGAGLGVAIVPASAVMLEPKGCALRLLANPTRAGALACIQLRGDPNPLSAMLGGIAD